MLRIKAKAKTSPLHGMGLFAQEFIPKGTITWQYDPGYDTSFDEDTYNRLDPESKELFLRHSYYDFNLKKYILCGDDLRYINHSWTPNITSEPDKDIAARDIQPGEELLCNYEDYEKGWFERRGFKPEDFN